jgi:HAD superfamily hydrolase (TIGR01484 family)
LQPWSQVAPSELAAVRGICLDIDDTLSTSGKLTSQAYEGLWRLKEAGYAVVPITGRPAGWCDMIARFWPVDAVIGENGAFSFFMEKGKFSRRTHPRALLDPKSEIERLSQAVKREFPHAQWASDQSYRQYDLAIDFCEDVPPWSRAEVDRLVALCEQQGAHAKVSSIHVNAWFGDYDKYSGFQDLLAAKGAVLGLPSESQWLFIGDSPNDEPLFARFAMSVGVANLKAFSDRLQFPPRFLTQGKSGDGFVEMVNRMIDVAHSREP